MVRRIWRLRRMGNGRKAAKAAQICQAGRAAGIQTAASSQHPQTHVVCLHVSKFLVYDVQAYQDFASRFYETPRAIDMYHAFVKLLVQRRNTFNGRLYREDPTILSWQLANEPRALSKGDAYRSWIQKTARLIRSMDCAHLISLGSEGVTRWPEYVQNDYVQDSLHVDYVTVHVRPEDWGWCANHSHIETYQIVRTI